MTLPPPITRTPRPTTGSVATSGAQTPSGVSALPTFGVVETNACATKRLGAASELRASVHLMQQGFDVYRCLAPTAPFDLVASREGELFRVEVKTISASASPRAVPVFGWPTNDSWDILILCADQAIFQFPFGITRDEVHVAVAKKLGIEPVSKKLRALMGLEDPQPSIHEWIIGVMSADPAAVWTNSILFEAMTAQGWVTRNANPRGWIGSELSVLADRGRIERVARGSYVLLVNDEEGVA